MTATVTGSPADRGRRGGRVGAVLSERIGQPVRDAVGAQLRPWRPCTGEQTERGERAEADMGGRASRVGKGGAAGT